MYNTFSTLQPLFSLFDLRNNLKDCLLSWREGLCRVVTPFGNPSPWYLYDIQIHLPLFSLKLSWKSCREHALKLVWVKTVKMLFFISSLPSCLLFSFYFKDFMAYQGPFMISCVRPKCNVTLSLIHRAVWNHIWPWYQSKISLNKKFETWTNHL